ncbi:MAG: putative DNA binding domain-containing protein [Clostridia bacterium]|nr:putative DNA binding domain-containing protein [Clostridia bacterium]
MEGTVSKQTLQQWRTEKEGQFFDRKSARIAPKDLATHICAFANASGGSIVVGIEDNGKLSGVSQNQENELRQAVLDFFVYMPEVKIEVFFATAEDCPKGCRLLTFGIAPSYDSIIKTKSGEAYLRVGDKSRKLSTAQLMELEYSKGTRSYETTIIPDASFDDLNDQLIHDYVQILNPSASNPQELLRARGLIRRISGEDKITVAGLLLFGKQPTQFLPSARVRFLRYEGTRAGVGTNINIVKDVTLESALPTLLRKGQELLESQMREFQHLSKEGVFEKVPEYPPFTWLEGLVNAVTHRDYSIQGDYIRISMFDDRIEITSPGSFPSIVTVDNIQNTRFSRNPLIARVLSDFGWVRELNEGVRRIYQDMQAFFLEPPIYQVLNRNTVCLTLKNNIATRSLRKLETGFPNIGEVWNNMKPIEKDIAYYLANVPKCTPKDLMDLTGKSRPTILRYIKKMIEANIVEEHAASTSDPTKYYSLTGATLKLP